MKKKKIKILHVAQAAGGVDRYIRMLLKYLDKEKFENILVCSQDFREKDYKNLVDFFEQVKMDRAIGSNDLKAIGEVRRLIKRYNPDIVYAHSSKAGAIARVADIGLKNHCLYNPHTLSINQSLLLIRHCCWIQMTGHQFFLLLEQHQRVTMCLDSLLRGILTISMLRKNLQSKRR